MKLKDINKQYIELLKNMNEGRCTFSNRADQTVFLETQLQDWGSVNIIYFMDKEIICIFKEDNCLYTSQILNRKLRTQISTKIEEVFGDQIKDTVNLLGFPFSKSNIINKLEELKTTQEYDAEKVVEDEKLDIDQILDKINDLGYEKLSNGEKEFLKNFKI